MVTQKLPRRPGLVERVLTWSNDRDLFFLASALFVVGVVGLLALRGILARWPLAAESSPPIVVLATATPALVAPTVDPPVEHGVEVASAGRTLPRALIAYGAPERSSAIGAVEAGRPYTPTARMGEWVEVDLAGSGRVWIAVADLAGLDGVAEIEPAAAPAVVSPAVSNPAPERDTSPAGAPAVAAATAAPVELAGQPAECPAGAVYTLPLPPERARCWAQQAEQRAQADPTPYKPWAGVRWVADQQQQQAEREDERAIYARQREQP